jgi:dipeptidase E
MGKIVAIGGVTPPSSLDLIDEEIIKLTNKKHPKILYVPTAGGDNLGYCEFYRGIYEGRFGCKMDVLFLINEEPSLEEIREKIFSSDIIYVGGGSVVKLIKVLEKFKVISMIKEAYEKGIVFAGISAGALCWGMNYFDSEFTAGFKTIEGFSEYTKEDCMKFLPFIICPHYNLDGYKEKMDLMIQEYKHSGIAIDNNCAVQFVDGKYRVIATKEEANAYKVYKKGTKIVREAIIKHEEFRPVEELLVNN